MDAFSPYIYNFLRASIFHLDGKQIHSKEEKYHKLIVDFLCCAWDKQWPKNDQVNRPFQNVPFVKPRVTWQRGDFECGDILIFFMAQIIKSRGSISYTKKQFESSLDDVIRCNSAFVYTQDDMVKQRQKVKSACLMISNAYHLKESRVESRVEISTGLTVVSSEQPSSKEEGEHRSDKKTTSSPQVSTMCPAKPTTAIATVETESTKPSLKVPRPSIDNPASCSSPSATTMAVAKVKTATTAAEAKRRQRRNKWYKDQAEELGLLMAPRTVEFFNGTYPTVSWKMAMQISFPGEIEVYKKRGHRNAEKVVGVIAVDVQRGDYFPIPESFVKRKIPGQVDGEYLYDICTGAMKFGSNSVPLVLVCWNNEYSFYPEDRIKHLPSTRERTRNAPNRLQANEVGNLTCVGMTTQINAKPAIMHMGICPHATVKMYNKYFTDNNRDRFSMSARMIENIDRMNGLVAEGRLWLAVAVARDAERQITNRGAARDNYSEKGKAVHAEKILVLTLLFEIISKRRPSEFEPDAVVTNMSNCELSHAVDTGKKRQKRKVCKSDGCDTLSHYAGKGFCFKHSKSRKLCNICKKSEGRCSGGTCRGCFGRMYSKEDLRQARMCRVCKCIESREIGGRCKGCMPKKKQKLTSS